MSTIRSFLETSVNQTPDAVAQTFRCGNAWVSRSYREFYERVVRAAEGVASLNVRPHLDRSAMMLDNGPEWQEIYMAHAGAGVAVVPLDPKLHLLEVVHILRDSECSVVYLGAKLKDLIRAALPQLPHLRHVVMVGDPEAHGYEEQGRAFWDYESLLEKTGKAVVATQSWFARNVPTADDVASILYTSGTMGQPKGAMLSHANFCANVESTLQVVPIYPSDNFFVVLPLFHAYSFTANFMIPIRLGARMSFVQSLRTVSDDMRALSPTILMAVPLMAEKMYDKIMPKIRANLAARLLLALGMKRLVVKKVIDALGGKLRFFGVGGAPCPIEVFKGFRRIGFPIVEGYGITECAPGVVYGCLADYTPGYVGRIIPGMTMRIKDPDAAGVGELQVKGPNVMLGYFNNAEMTAEAFDDGWFCTGDLCVMNAEGYIAIRGRKKALIVNREGKNIYPEEVEQCIARHPLVGDVVVIGYHAAGGQVGERVGAIVTPDMDAVKATHGGVEPEWPAVEAELREAVQRQCNEIAEFKWPRKIDIRRDPLERTSTQKVRRVSYQHALDE